MSITNFRPCTHKLTFGHKDSQTKESPLPIYTLNVCIDCTLRCNFSTKDGWMKFCVVHYQSKYELKIFQFHPTTARNMDFLDTQVNLKSIQLLPQLLHHKFRPLHLVTIERKSLSHAISSLSVGDRFHRQGGGCDGWRVWCLSYLIKG